MFKKKRRLFVTLLETLIAAGLLALLLVIIFGFFRELSIMSTATEIQQKESFKQRYLETRLAYIFERIVNERDNARTFFFYTQPPNGEFSSFTSLIFTFNNGIRFDPMFSGDVLARLYVDKASGFGREATGNLVLAMWPLHVDNPEQYMKKEVLLENVSKIRFEFYAAPAPQSNNEDPINRTPFVGNNTAAKQPLTKQQINPNADNEIALQRGSWHDNQWFFSYNEMPSIIKIWIKTSNPPNVLEKGNYKTKKDKKLFFSFVLPSSKNPVTYPSESAL